MGCLLNDKQIKELCLEKNMIEPFIDHKVSEGLPSYGLSHAGYDIRIADEFYVFTPALGAVIDFKNLQKTQKYYVEIKDDSCIIPPNSYVLAKSVEKFNMPENIFATCMNKSTCARVGIFANITPIEPNWKGYLTIEIANLSQVPVKIYAGMGIAQILFYKIDKPTTVYEGKYQNQNNQITLAK